MSDGENFSRGPSFVYKNHESVSYTISTGGGGSGRGNIEVTYDALRKRIAELEAALRQIIGTLDDPTGGQHVADMRAASSIAIAAMEGGKDEC